ncbi:hypothetical protein OG985_12585 [Streptomyces sp. NBC_00289]|uniref:hypothetical protein n=1 Tax=Streptomyces sp. NBC_00289 TaxID=2975703 RepID=UPI003254C7C5
MGREEYWVAISQDGVLYGAGFFVTRHFVVTSAGCLPVAGLGSEVELRTAEGRGLRGVVDEIAEDVGLALVHVVVPARVDYPTPRADRAVKGDSWRAPYRPGPAHPPLCGTVEDVLSPCRRTDADRALSILELTVGEQLGLVGANGYAGGPVERHETGRQETVLGVLLEAEYARGIRGDQGSPLVAGDIGGVIDAFDGLNPHRMLGLLTERDPAAMAVETPDPPETPDGSRRDEVAAVMDAVEFGLRKFRDWAAEGIVDERDLPPYQIAMLDVVVQAAKGAEAHD